MYNRKKFISRAVHVLNMISLISSHFEHSSIFLKRIIGYKVCTSKFTLVFAQLNV